ncbi:hypothetical protein EVAR_30571_1 [Eumeta japonica]|uniref:Uncharacterized protein n=1 Tax=Eumeta variegata TaxID=151549 RepID=A0A4C1VQ24_EUMVA|nr:hypothetical protein EVAR_30571_1 [Eumeta japonica]
MRPRFDNGIRKVKTDKSEKPPRKFEVGPSAKQRCLRYKNNENLYTVYGQTIDPLFLATNERCNNRSCAAAASLLLGRIDRRSGREIARSALSLAHSAPAERDNESRFFVRAAGVHRFLRRYHVETSGGLNDITLIISLTHDSQLAPSSALSHIAPPSFGRVNEISRFVYAAPAGGGGGRSAMLMLTFTKCHFCTDTICSRIPYARASTDFLIQYDSIQTKARAQGRGSRADDLLAQFDKTNVK